MSPQSAYALRNRDAMFAAGWDAACALARDPLADALREQAVDGLTETISRDGEIVAERHRHDSRLSIAVLHRLDKRCDRAEEQGARYLPLIARWDEWLDHVGKGEDSAALAVLERADPKNSPDHQLHQLPLGENPTGGAGEGDEEDDGPDHFWMDDEGEWITDFPPPLDFDGFEEGVWGRHRYRRQCTAQESGLLDRLASLDKEAEQAAAEQERDLWLADMALELTERTEQAGQAEHAENAEHADLPPAPSPA